jgi:D-beta-D-heptose 7-phosphate kinase/D-beta-D-heptose 1-phosphate adenosyltransferase
MRLFERDKKSTHLPTVARKVYDVTGAGDTVIATLAVALGAGADLATAAQIANTAAGIAVERVGTTAVSVKELQEELLQEFS